METSSLDPELLICEQFFHPPCAKSVRATVLSKRLIYLSATETLALGKK